ncbi:MAG: branched-chain amino acid ABC transporter permease [Reyranella sp.]|uniref:branched-chain amino acid ABC transporter permease n=1 Tax=Reyranella sp. TaxID=1929291 RepID=UPI003D12D628
MTGRDALIGIACLAGVALLAGLPFVVADYGLSLAINIMSYTVLATAWSLFSGPTRYVSLATVAFFGIGAYTTAVFVETLPWPLVLLIAMAVGSVVAALVGLATLRLSGVYFVIFSFGLAELVRQLVTWFEVNKTRTLGRYVFADITAAQIYWQLLALAVLVFAIGFLIGRSRLGLALRAIGDDETVARHSGIDVTRAKVALFVLSTVFMTLTGAIMAPRWTYIDPAIAFNPVVSFTVLIMALLGGVHRLYGPVLGVVPLALLFEYLVARFPNHFSIMVGVVFIVIVYLIPRGVAGLVEDAARRRVAAKGTA